MFLLLALIANTNYLDVTTIKVPAYVNMIFLSATTPNTFEFSDWIGRTKRRSVYVLKTNHRPVPLSHYLWANLKLHTVKEGNSGFYDKGYQEACNSLQPKDNKNKSSSKGKSKPVYKAAARGPQNLAWQAQGKKSDWVSLIRFLERENLTPTVIFSFSKKKCEEIANMLRSLNLNTGSECAATYTFTKQTIARLSPIDATLPQVLTVCEMVKRGIGVHHGGLLPILKEMVEVRKEIPRVECHISLFIYRISHTIYLGRIVIIFFRRSYFLGI